MRAFLKFLFYGFLSCLLFAYVVGLFLPTEHSMTIKATFDQPVDELWQTIADFENAPKWNAVLKEVKRLPDQNAHEVWQEDYDGKVFQFETLERVEGQRLKRKILNENLPYQATWTFVLISKDKKTELKITEDVVIEGAFDRFLDKFIIGQGDVIAGFMLAFAKKYDQKINIEVVRNDA